MDRTVNPSLHGWSVHHSWSLFGLHLEAMIKGPDNTTKEFTLQWSL